MEDILAQSVSAMVKMSQVVVNLTDEVKVLREEVERLRAKNALLELEKFSARPPVLNEPPKFIEVPTIPPWTYPIPITCTTGGIGAECTSWNAAV